MQQQAYPVENKGTLLPGQTISVNKYTVQVERYLSQGPTIPTFLFQWLNTCLQVVSPMSIS